MKTVQVGDVVSGILIKRNFNYQVVDPKELTGYSFLRWQFYQKWMSFLPVFTDLSSSRLSQRQSVYYSGSLPLLLYSLNQLNDDAILTAELKPTDTTAPTHVFSVFGVSVFRGFSGWMKLSVRCSGLVFAVAVCFGSVIVVLQRAISLQWCSLASICVLDWESNPVNDMYADAVMAAILHAQTNPIPEKCKYRHSDV